MSLMVSISGVRGIVGESLTPDVVVRYAAAFAAYCRRARPERREIVVGRDGRVTGAAIQDLVTATLTSAGADVRTLGVCPTPTVQLAVEHERAAGGIAITASHNPIQWNGLKFLASTGMFLDADENRELWAIAAAAPQYAPWSGVGRTVADTTWIRRHIDAVLGMPVIDADAIRRRRFRVVLDCVNAAGGVIVPALLRELGCDLVEMNCDVGGVFAHTPEPVPENLTDVAARVRAEGADLGIAVDPDVDRLVLITEEGLPYGEENTVASAVRLVLEREPGPATVVVNLSTTRAVDDIAAAHGARTIRTPVGEINVARRMKSEGAVIGGEGSGGVIYPRVHLGRDAIVGIGLLLELLASSGGTLSQLKRSLPQYAITKGRMEVAGLAPEEVLRRLAAEHAGRGRITTEDGLKIDFPDCWVHLRKSNTEPIIRIIAEARTAAEAEDLVRRFQREISAPR